MVTYSEDGEWMWDGQEWIPAPPSNNPVIPNTPLQQQVPQHQGYQQQVPQHQGYQQQVPQHQGYQQQHYQPQQEYVPSSTSQRENYDYSLKQKSKFPKIVIGTVISIAVLLILSWVLYVWADALTDAAQEDEIEGKWLNWNDERIDFNSDKSGSGTGDWEFDGWRFDGDSAIGFCIDRSTNGCDDFYYYVWEYDVQGDVLYIAPHEDVNGNIADSGCIFWVKFAEDYSHYNSTKGLTSEIPSWCKW